MRASHEWLRDVLHGWVRFLVALKILSMVRPDSISAKALNLNVPILGGLIKSVFGYEKWAPVVDYSPVQTLLLRLHGILWERLRSPPLRRLREKATGNGKTTDIASELDDIR